MFEADRGEREPIPKLMWVENRSSVDNDWCRHGVNEIAARRPPELLLLGQKRHSSALLWGIRKPRAQ